MLGISAAAGAATVPIEDSLKLYEPQGSRDYTIATSDPNAAGRDAYYELVVDPSWQWGTKFTTFSTEPTGSLVSYKLYNDLNTAWKIGDTGNLVTSWSLTDLAANNQEPFYSYVLGAGAYILQITTLPGEYSVSTRISSVPVPGAALLLASGLLGLLGLSRRGGPDEGVHGRTAAWRLARAREQAAVGAPALALVPARPGAPEPCPRPSRRVPPVPAGARGATRAGRGRGDRPECGRARKDLLSRGGIIALSPPSHSPQP